MLQALKATHSNVIGNIDHSKVSELEVRLPELYFTTWAEYPALTNASLCVEVMKKLNELFETGRKDKKRRVSADRAWKILVDQIIECDWEQRVLITVPRIKAFFQLDRDKQTKLINDNDLNQYMELVQENEEDELDEEIIDTADSLKDIENDS